MKQFLIEHIGKVPKLLLTFLNLVEKTYYQTILSQPQSWWNVNNLKCESKIQDNNMISPFNNLERLDYTGWPKSFVPLALAVL